MAARSLIPEGMHLASLESIQKRTDEMKVSYGGEDILVRWKPGLLTDDFFEQLANVYDEARRAEGATAPVLVTLRGKVAELIDWWDLTEKEGPESKDNPMVPLTNDGLKRVPEPLLMRITRRMLEEAEEGEVSGRSDSGGQAGAPSGTSHDGPHSFE